MSVTGRPTRSSTQLTTGKTTTTPRTGSLSNPTQPGAAYNFRGPVIEHSSGSDDDHGEDGRNGGDSDDDGDKLPERWYAGTDVASSSRPTAPYFPSHPDTKMAGSSVAASAKTSLASPPPAALPRDSDDDDDQDLTTTASNMTVKRDPKFPQPPPTLPSAEHRSELPAFRIVGHPAFADPVHSSTSMPQPKHPSLMHSFGPRPQLPHPHIAQPHESPSQYSDSGSDVRTPSTEGGVGTNDSEKLWAESEDLYRAIFQGHLLDDEREGRSMPVPVPAHAPPISNTPSSSSSSEAPPFPGALPQPSLAFPVAQSRAPERRLGTPESDYESLFYKRPPPPFPQAPGSGRAATLQSTGAGYLAMPRPPLEEKQSTETFFTVPSENRDSMNYLNAWDSHQEEDEEDEEGDSRHEEDENATQKLAPPLPVPTPPIPASLPAGARPPAFPQASQSPSGRRYNTTGYGKMPEASPPMPKPSSDASTSKPLVIPQPQHHTLRPQPQAALLVPVKLPTAVSMPSGPGGHSTKPTTATTLSSYSEGNPSTLNTRPTYGQATHVKPSTQGPPPPVPALPQLGQAGSQTNALAPIRPSEYGNGNPMKPESSFGASPPKPSTQATLKPSGSSLGTTNSNANLNAKPSSASVSKPPASSSTPLPKPPSASASASAFKPPTKPQTSASQISEQPHDSSHQAQDGGGGGGSKHVGTRYVSMLLALDDIPNYWNMLASFFTWILLAGFLLFPGTFTSWQQEQSAANAGVAPQVTDEFKKAVLGVVSHVPLFVIAFLCSGIGAAGMGWLWWRWKANYVWLLNKIFVPGLLNALAGLLSTLANIFGAQGGQFSDTAKVTVIVTGSACAVTGVLVLFYQFWLLRRVQNEHFREIGGKVAKGRHGEGVLKGMVESRRKVKEGV